MSARKENRGGFTLVELAVVIVIIGVLASFGVPQFMKSVERTKATEAFHFLSAVRSAQERYRAREGSYATRLSDLELQWRTDLATGAPVLKYFTISAAEADAKSWSLRLTRSGPSNGYKYDVMYTNDGYDPTRSTIEKHPEINPVTSSPGT
ncbi:MAG: type IV pilin protein [Isosphaeraceae bacterium]